MSVETRRREGGLAHATPLLVLALVAVVALLWGRPSWVGGTATELAPGAQGCVVGAEAGRPVADWPRRGQELGRSRYEVHTYFVAAAEGAPAAWVHNASIGGPVPRPGMTPRMVTDPAGREVPIYGQAEHASSTTEGHASTMNDLAEQAIQRGGVKHVTLQRSWRTATGRVSKSRLIPDVIVVHETDVVDAYEVQSDTDDPRELRRKLRRGRESLPVENRGRTRVVKPKGGC